MVYVVFVYEYCAVVAVTPLKKVAIVDRKSKFSALFCWAKRMAGTPLSTKYLRARVIIWTCSVISVLMAWM
jgi:hypothetical protein